MSSYTNSQIYSLAEYLSNGLPVHTDPASLIDLRPTRLLASSADPTEVELARSTLPLKLNLRFSLSQHPTLPRISTPCLRSMFGLVPRSSTPPVQRFLTPLDLRISTFSVCLSAHKAFDSSLVVATSALIDPTIPSFRCQLQLPSCPLGLHMIRLVRIEMFDRSGCL